ncbi:unnamed protein product, partial [Discosporangium mesarthrocarpum]
AGGGSGPCWTTLEQGKARPKNRGGATRAWEKKGVQGGPRKQTMSDPQRRDSRKRQVWVSTSKTLKGQDSVPAPRPLSAAPIRHSGAGNSSPRASKGVSRAAIRGGRPSTATLPS